MLSARHGAHPVDASFVADDLDVAVFVVDFDRLDGEQHVAILVNRLQVVADRNDDVVTVLGQTAHVDTDPSISGPEVPAVADDHPDVRGAEALGGDVCDDVNRGCVGDRLAGIADLGRDANCRRVGHVHTPDYSVAVTYLFYNLYLKRSNYY